MSFHQSSFNSLNHQQKKKSTQNQLLTDKQSSLPKKFKSILFEYVFPVAFSSPLKSLNNYNKNNFRVNMQQRTQYRIFSKSSYKSKTQQSEFSTATYKLKNPKQNLNSIVYLSSVIQTQNLLINNFNPSQTNYSQRKPNVGLQTINIGEQNIQDEMQLPKARKKSKIQRFMQTQRKEFRNTNALSNILGQFIPISMSRPKQSSIEQNIQKARTFTTMPLNKSESLSVSKNIKNQIRLKQQFSQFITGFKKKSSSIRLSNKMATQPRQTYKNNTIQRYKDRHSQAETVDLYNFLKKPTSKNSRMRKTQQFKVQYPVLSKRMAEIMLRNQLGPEGSNFNLAKLGNRRSFKMKINAS